MDAPEAGPGWGPADQGSGIRLLLVEDDDAIARQLARGLARAGYAVEHAPDARSALSAPAADVALVDLGLPDLDGTEVCRRLRAASHDLVLVVVTARGDEADRVNALDLGADDYLVKPFGFAELLARLRAARRRAAPEAGSGGERELLRAGALSVDLRTRTVHVHGEPIALTAKEFAVLVCLAEDPGRVLTRQEILERVWDSHWYGPTKVLDVHVAALRRKLGNPALIETSYGVGFRLAPDTG